MSTRSTVTITHHSISPNTSIITRWTSCKISTGSSLFYRLQLYHTFSLVDKIRGNVASVKLHSFDNIQLIDCSFTILYSDDPASPDLLHSIRYEVTDHRITISWDCSNLQLHQTRSEIVATCHIHKSIHNILALKLFQLSSVQQIDLEFLHCSLSVWEVKVKQRWNTGWQTKFSLFSRH